jgi:hypothetical protein
MCNCESEHPGIDCSSHDCRCHDIIDFDFLIMGIPRMTAERIVKFALSITGPAEMTLRYEKPIEVEVKKPLIGNFPPKEQMPDGAWFVPKDPDEYEILNRVENDDPMFMDIPKED